MFREARWWIKDHAEKPSEHDCSGGAPVGSRVTCDSASDAEMEDDPSEEHSCTPCWCSNHSVDNCCQLEGLANHCEPQKTDGDIGNANKDKCCKSESCDWDNGKPVHAKQELNSIVNAIVEKAKRGDAKRKHSAEKANKELDQFKNLSTSGSKEDHAETSVSNMETQLNSEDSSESWPAQHFQSQKQIQSSG